MTSEPQHDYRWLILVALYALAALWGAVNTLSTNAVLYALGAVLFASLATGWVALDARRRGNPLLSVVQMIIFFTWYVSVPIYLVASRGWRGLGYALLHGFLLMVTIAAFIYATLYCFPGFSISP